MLHHNRNRSSPSQVQDAGCWLSIASSCKSSKKSKNNVESKKVEWRKEWKKDLLGLHVDSVLLFRCPCSYAVDQKFSGPRPGRENQTQSHVMPPVHMKKQKNRTKTHNYSNQKTNPPNRQPVHAIFRVHPLNKNMPSELCQQSRIQKQIPHDH